MGRGRNKSGKVWRAKVARVAKNVTLKNQETKYYEYVGSNTATGGAGTVIPLYSNGGSTSGSQAPFSDLPLINIDQGSGKSQRLGSQITLKGMHMRLNLQQDPNNQYFTQVRIIVAWTDPNFSTITAGNLFHSPAVAGNQVIAAQLKGPTHQDSILRKVLVDRVFNLSVGNAPYSASNLLQTLTNRVQKINIPFHNKKYQFISGTAAILGEHEDLRVFMFAYSPGIANTIQVSNVYMNNRVYYKDG